MVIIKKLPTKKREPIGLTPASLVLLYIYLGGLVCSSQTRQNCDPISRMHLCKVNESKLAVSPIAVSHDCPRRAITIRIIDDLFKWNRKVFIIMIYLLYEE